ncbi:ATP-dependent DNA ligase [Candidatus Dojkabacteria bacterium]|nr:ATP-dependent DNA ligase [Candidatus Dojkabacteria bacterium]
MKFKELGGFFEKIEATASRLEMTDILADLYGHCSSEESAIVSYLLVGRVVPMFVPVEFNVANKLLLKVLDGIRISAGLRKSAKDIFNESGDLGLVASELMGKAVSRGKGMSIKEVYDSLWGVALVEGVGSVDIRNQKMHKLFVGLSPVEAKYVARILAQKLRLGCSSKTVLDAVSVAIKGDKSDRDEIERAYGVSSDLGHVVSLYLKKGISGLRSVDIIPGVPVASMLVEREKDAESIMNRFPEAIVQPKFDGLRCQIHIGKESNNLFENRVWWKYWGKRESDQQGMFADSIKEKRVRLFSRNLEDMTDMFPEVVDAAGKLKVESAVLDSEVIGYDDSTGEFSPFQETMIRKRKYDIKGAAERVPVKAFVFDLLYLNGRTLMHEGNQERIGTLSDIVGKEDTIIESSSYKVESAKGLEEIFQQNISQGLEGVIIKDPNSYYKPGKRGFDWIKMKRAFEGHLADSIDIVILGYYFGRGRQADFGIGALLGAVYDSSSDEFVSIAKVGTGITDDQWREIKKDLDDIKSNSKPKRVNVEKSLVPDQWVYPQIVSTIEADEITKSPIHTAGAGRDETGFALRFPRLKVWKRDKQPEDATSVKEITEMYDEQK